MIHKLLPVISLILVCILCSLPLQAEQALTYDAIDALTVGAAESAQVVENKSIGIVDVFSRLNVRNGPSTDYAILGKLYPGEEITILGEQNGWLKIEYRGSTAWVCGYYVWQKGKGTRNPAIRNSIQSRFGDLALGNRGASSWYGEAGKANRPSSLKATPDQALESMPVGPRVGKRLPDGGLDIPLYSQFTCDARVPSGFCGPTSLKMAMEYYGQKHHVNTCAEGVYIPGSGASHAGMLNRLKKFGMTGCDMTWGKSLAWLKQQTDAGYPVIVSVKGQYAPGKSSSCGHILCIVGVTADGNVIMNDSNGGKRRISPGSMFRRGWHGGSGGGMAIVVKK